MYFAPAGDAGAQLEPPDVQHVEGDLVPLADLAQHVLHGNLRILEDERGRGGALDPHLLLLGAGGDAGEGALHEERREVLAVDLGEDGVEVGEAAVGDELLRAVQDVVFAVRGQRGDRAASQRVAAGFGLGEAVGGDPLGGDDLGEVLLLLLLRPVINQRQRPDPGVGGDRRREPAVQGRLLRGDQARSSWTAPARRTPRGRRS